MPEEKLLVDSDNLTDILNLESKKLDELERICNPSNIQYDKHSCPKNSFFQLIEQIEILDDKAFVAGLTGHNIPNLDPTVKFSTKFL